MHRRMGTRSLTGLATLLLGFLAPPLGGQTPLVAPYFGGGLVAQRQTGTSLETAVGYTIVGGLSRRLTSALRLHADVRYSFGLSLGSAPTSPCPGSCPPSGFAATKVLSTQLAVELLTSPRTAGILLRLGGGLQTFMDPPSGRAGTYPALAAAIGLRLPLGPREAFVLEGRYERLLGVAAGPHDLWPVLLGLEL